MKVIFFALALIAGISAAPEQKAGVALSQRNFIEDLVRGVITLIIENIENSGLDPIDIEAAEGKYTLLGEDVFTAEGTVAGLTVVGLSQITINDVTFGILSGVNLDLTLAKLAISADALVGEATILGNRIEGEISGKLLIENLNLVARINLSILPSISIRGITGTITVGNVESDLKVISSGEDVSEKVNDFLTNLQEALDAYNTQIFEYILRAIELIIESLL